MLAALQHIGRSFQEATVIDLGARTLPRWTSEGASCAHHAFHDWIQYPTAIRVSSPSRPWTTFKARLLVPVLRDAEGSTTANDEAFGQVSM